jgi:hypothetical protein
VRGVRSSFLLSIEEIGGAGCGRVLLLGLLRPRLGILQFAFAFSEDELARAAGLDFGELAPAERERYLSRAGFEPIGLHEARHTFASLMIAAGVNAKALSTYMGHSSITITLDRYGHLMPGNEDESAALLNEYLQQAEVDTAARHAQLETEGGRVAKV